MIRTLTLALAGALALVCAPASAHEAVDVYLASLGQQPTTVGATGRPFDLVRAARRHVGATARDLRLPSTLWCADFVNLARREAGLSPVPSRLARDQMRGGRIVAAAAPGAIVVLSRRGGRAAAHTGIVSGVTPDGALVVISGNSGRRDRSGRRVTEAVYPRSRVIAAIDPT